MFKAGLDDMSLASLDKKRKRKKKKSIIAFEYIVISLRDNFTPTCLKL